MRIAFGAYAGSKLEDVPLNYLHWLLANVAISMAMKAEIATILATHGYDPTGENSMPFGKYAGFLLEEVPLSYLSWALANVELTATLKEKMHNLMDEANYPKNGHLRPMHGGGFLKTKRKR